MREKRSSGRRYPTVTLKAIFFDAAGTLFKTVRPVGESYSLLARKYGVNVSPERVSERFQSCFSSSPPLAFPRARDEQIHELERAWWKELVRKIFQPWNSFSQFDDYFSELFAYFTKAEAWSLYPETAGILSALKKQGFILDVISNFDSRIFGILYGLGIASRFDSVVISSRVGHAKPDPEIFHATLHLHGLKSEEALHVGDSPDKDAAGAAAAGLTAVLLNRRKSVVPSSSFTQISNLRQILPIVERLR